MTKQLITTNIAIAYSQCPRKAFLMLSGVKSGKPHEYVQILSQKRHNAQTQYLESQTKKGQEIRDYYAEHGMASKSAYLSNATLKTDIF